MEYGGLFLGLGVLVVAVVLATSKSSRQSAANSHPSDIAVKPQLPTKPSQAIFNADADFLPDDLDEEWRSFRSEFSLDSIDYAENYLDRIPCAVWTYDTTFRGTGMSHKVGNWTGMYKKFRARGGQERATYAVLVPELNNPYDRFAVAICVHGRHIGYVPKTESQSVRGFLDKNGGLVKVPVTLWFDPRTVKNSIRVHIAKPFELADNFQTDLKPIFWSGSKWKDPLIGFVED